MRSKSSTRVDATEGEEEMVRVPDRTREGRLRRNSTFIAEREGGSNQWRFYACLYGGAYEAPKRDCRLAEVSRNIAVLARSGSGAWGWSTNEEPAKGRDLGGRGSFQVGGGGED